MKVYVVIDGEGGLQELALVTFDQPEALACYENLVVKNGDQFDLPGDAGEGAELYCVDGKYYSLVSEYGEPVARIFEWDIEGRSGTIYVVVENVPVAERGEYNVEEALVKVVGYFADPQQAEVVVDALNAKYVAKLREEGLDEDDADWEEDRFGFVFLEPAKDDPAALRKLQVKLGGKEPRAVPEAILCDTEPDDKFDVDGYQLSDGGVIEWPDDDGTLRRRDQFGNLEEVRTPDDANHGEWLRLFRGRKIFYLGQKVHVDGEPTDSEDSNAGWNERIASDGVVEEIDDEAECLLVAVESVKGTLWFNMADVSHKED